MLLLISCLLLLPLSLFLEGGGPRSLFCYALSGVLSSFVITSLW